MHRDAREALLHATDSPALPLSAVGLLAVLATMTSPATGEQATLLTSVDALTRRVNAGRTAVERCVRELETCGYLVRQRQKVNGLFAGGIWQLAAPGKLQPPATGRNEDR